MEKLSSNPMNPAVLERATDLFSDQIQAIWNRTDHSLAVLLVVEWLGAIAVACFISPRTWSGTLSHVHIHVWTAIFLGGAITLFPITLSVFRAGHLSTRHVMAVGQMGMSAVLIHLTGGRIETHFLIFGSLAFLSFYRNWPVLLTGSLVVVADHLFRGVYWPQSVFGVLNASPWRALEHGFWVVFEDAFLITSILQSVRDMQILALRQARLENTNQEIEMEVLRQTQQLNESQKRLQLSEKMSAIGQLAAGVAHEINNPLGVILGFAQSLVRRMRHDDPLEMPLKSMEREAIRCKGLVQDLLTFSRVSKVEREPIDMNRTITAALSLVNAQARLKHIDIRQKFAAGLPRVLANPNQVQQIIVNLASNAFDAMNETGVLTITTELLNEGALSWIQMTFTDTGNGIPKEIVPRIFEPFFTTKSLGQGTGLGLALIHEIVTKHSGQIDVQSRPGCTEFRIKLPVRRDSPTEGAARAA